MTEEINLKNGSKIMDVKSKEKVKGFPKQKCNYPGCKKEGCYMQPFTIINEDSSSIELLFCQYHHLIVMGGHFKAKIINEEVNLLGEKKPWNFELIGPFKEVEIAEQVIGAREMIKLASDNKDLKS